MLAFIAYGLFQKSKVFNLLSSLMVAHRQQKGILLLRIHIPRNNSPVKNILRMPYYNVDQFCFTSLCSLFADVAGKRLLFIFFLSK
jgi:hypothetical protein